MNSVPLHATNSAKAPVRTIGTVAIIGVIALGAAIVPAFYHRSAAAANVGPSPETLTKETSLHNDLSVLRNAEYQFFTDTNYYPAQLSDLTACSVKLLSVPLEGIDGYGKSVKITAKCFHGPYINSIPTDPVSGEPFNYSLVPGEVGEISSSAVGNASDGTVYSKW